jgi:hypothetical protein
MRRFLLHFLVCLVLLACSSDDEGGTSKTPPGKVFGFVPTATASGPAVSLRQKELTDTHLVLELVGHQLPDVYGIAYRLNYTTAALTFEKQDAGTIFSSPLSLANEKTPGLVAGVVTQKGPSTGANGSDKVLATLSFVIVKQEAASIEFVANRSSVVDTAGAVDSASWTGGTLGFQ